MDSVNIKKKWKKTLERNCNIFAICVTIDSSFKVGTARFGLHPFQVAYIHSGNQLDHQLQILLSLCLFINKKLLCETFSEFGNGNGGIFFCTPPSLCRRSSGKQSSRFPGFAQMHPGMLLEISPV